MSAELTKNLLKSYYGFGEIKQKHSTKCLATHTGFDYLYFIDKIVSNNTNDCLTNNNLDRNDVNDKIDVKNVKNQFIIGDHLKRSWRALDDDTNLIVNHEANNELQNTPKIKNLDDNNTKNLKLNYFCETDNRNDVASDISSMSMKKNKKKKQIMKLPDAVLSIPVVEKKMPIITDQFFDMTNSHLEEFPQNFLNKIANIKMIYLERNLLSELPSDFFIMLRHLQWFDIRNNRLKSLPISIKNHPCLETIMLQGNLLKKLPLELGLILKLKTLHTSGNPLIYPSTDILNEGFSRIIHFLREEWNKINPNEQVIPSAGLKKIESSSTDNSNNLSTILKLTSGLSKQLKTTSSVSTLTLSSKKKNLTTREKSRNYKPSNRCRKIYNEEFLEEKLRWISKIKEILVEQSKVLQQNKSQDALNLWRMKRKNIDKNIEKAFSRTEENILFAIDMKDMPFFNSHNNKKSTNQKKASFFKNSDEIDIKMREIFESLKLSESRDQIIRNQGPDLRLNILRSKIKKIEELYVEIQELKKFNTTTISKNYNGPNIQTKSVDYKLLPSMIL